MFKFSTPSNFFYMNDSEKDTVFDCGRMPEALASIFTAENMPSLSDKSRRTLKYTLSLIEGSGPRDGMTCITEKEYPKLT